MTFKEKVYHQYRQLIEEKILLLQRTLDDLKESGTNETKSTAGDKHETALAMLQIEQENTRAQLKKVLDQKIQFEKIDITLYTSRIIPGSLIQTNRGWLFLSAALGKIKVDDTTVTAVSLQSPLGLKLLRLKAGDIACINETTYNIDNVQ